MTIRIPLTPKNIVSTVATVSVTFIAIVAVAASPETIRSWRTIIIVVGGIAIVASIIQMVLQSADDDKQSEMMQTLLAVVVRSENKPREPEKPSVELDSQKDPLVYVEIDDKRRGVMSPSTPIKLINRGKAPAHHVQIESLKLHSGDITFRPVEVLADGAEIMVLPEVEGIFAVFRHDLSRILEKDWNDQVARQTAGLPSEGQYDYVVPMSITYETYDLKARFETSFNLVYHVVQDLIQKDWKVTVEGEPPFLEIRNVQFRRLT